MSPASAPSAVGGRVAAIREALGLTAATFSTELSISRGYLSSLENGHAVPSRKLLMHLVRQFNVNPDYLVNGRLPYFSEIDALVAVNMRAAKPQPTLPHERCSLSEQLTHVIKASIDVWAAKQLKAGGVLHRAAERATSRSLGLLRQRRAHRLGLESSRRLRLGVYA